jgi:4-aminobutyrate aminotransferase-like enzyme
VAAAAASAVLDVIDDEQLIHHAGAMGELLRQRLSAAGHQPRGRGLLIGVPLPGLDVSAVLDEARRRGVLIGSTGRDNDVLKIRPPLVITPEQVEEVAAVVLAAIDREQVRADA